MGVLRSGGGRPLAAAMFLLSSSACTADEQLATCEEVSAAAGEVVVDMIDRIARFPEEEIEEAEEVVRLEGTLLERLEDAFSSEADAELRQRLRHVSQRHEDLRCGEGAHADAVMQAIRDELDGLDPGPDGELDPFELRKLRVLANLTVMLERAADADVDGGDAP